jgi:putative phosphoesterase
MSRIKEGTIGVLSDTHGRMRETLLEKLAGCELIIHAGDIGNEEVLNRLRNIGEVIAVKGNVDQGLWTAGLKDAEHIDFHEHHIFVIHNLDELKRHPLPAKLDVLIYGHSHTPSTQCKDGVLYLNPGSAGPKRFNLPTSIATLRLVDGQFTPEIVFIDDEQ